MSKNYPYIQGRKTLKDVECDTCHTVKPQVLQLEWRVDWFQGNCEFEKICQSCLDKRTNQERKKQEEYEARMEPVWEKQRANRDRKENNVRAIIRDMGLSLQEFDNRQWTIGGELDWWTTTGTAIERKSRKRHDLSFNKVNEIKKLLTKLFHHV